MAVLSLVLSLAPTLALALALSLALALALALAPSPKPKAMCTLPPPHAPRPAGPALVTLPSWVRAVQVRDYPYSGLTYVLTACRCAKGSSSSSRRAAPGTSMLTTDPLGYVTTYTT